MDKVSKLVRAQTVKVSGFSGFGKMLCNFRVAERDQLRRVWQLELACKDGVQPLALDQKQREGDHQIGQADEGQCWPFG